MIRLPSDHEKCVVIDFLRDSTNVWVENVRFERPAAGGLKMKCRYRDLKDETKHAELYGPECEDFETISVAMSDWLEHGMTREVESLTNPDTADGSGAN